MTARKHLRSVMVGIPGVSGYFNHLVISSKAAIGEDPRAFRVYEEEKIL